MEPMSEFWVWVEQGAALTHPSFPAGGRVWERPRCGGPFWPATPSSQACQALSPPATPEMSTGEGTGTGNLEGGSSGTVRGEALLSMAPQVA